MFFKAIEAYEGYRRSLSTKDLALAVEKFCEALDHQPIRAESSSAGFQLDISGFADKESKRNLLREIRILSKDGSLKVQILKYIFRPDVTYRIKGNYGLLSGWDLRVSSNNWEPIQRASRVVLRLTKETSLEIDSHQVLKLDEGGLINLALQNIAEVLPLIEATCSRDFASALCRQFTSHYSADLKLGDEYDWVKLFLVAESPFPWALESRGWRQVRNLDPVWEPLAQASHGGSIGSTESTNPLSVSTGGPNHLPQPSISRIHNADVFGGDLVIAENALMRLDAAANPAFTFVSGQWNRVVGTHSNLTRTAVRVPDGTSQAIDKGLLLTNRSDTNWYHWLIETLPKLESVDNLLPEGISIIV
jgi:hypothetical protein